MDRHESRALEELLTREQLLDCIDEQKKRAETLSILSSLADIAIEKGYVTLEQFEEALSRLDQESSQVDLLGLDTGDLAEPERATQSPGRPHPSPGRNDLFEVLDAAEPDEGRSGLTESTMQRNLLAQLAFSGEVDSEMCSAALTELAGESLVGKQLMGYRLVFLIGEGPISDVFKAIKPTDERVYALKLMPKRLFQSAVTVKRFISRARLASRLAHPNIVQPVDFGETERHLCYALYEYVEAVPLWLLIKRQTRLSERMSLAIIQFIARGLEYAHAAGCVHGNLKPANVLVTPKGVVKVADWGCPRTGMLLAARKINEQEARLSLISEGVSYLAPELIHGETEVTPACDVYSLGAMLYHLLTGMAPFSGERETMMPAILQGFPALPEGVGSPRCRALLAAMTLKDPAKRVHDAAALVGQIGAVIAAGKAG